MTGTPEPCEIPARLVADALRRDDRVMNVGHSRARAVMSGEPGMAWFSCGPGRSRIRNYTLSLSGPENPRGGRPADHGEASEDSAGAA